MVIQGAHLRKIAGEHSNADVRAKSWAVRKARDLTLERSHSSRRTNSHRGTVARLSGRRYLASRPATTLIVMATMATPNR
jgi:hypothetical protein